MTDLLRAPSVFLASAPRVARPPRPVRAWALLIVSGVTITCAALLMLVASIAGWRRW